MLNFIVLIEWSFYFYNRFSFWNVLNYLWHTINDYVAVVPFFKIIFNKHNKLARLGGVPDFEINGVKRAIERNEKTLEVYYKDKTNLTNLLNSIKGNISEFEYIPSNDDSNFDTFKQNVSRMTGDDKLILLTKFKKLLESVAFNPRLFDKIGILESLI